MQSIQEPLTLIEDQLPPKSRIYRDWGRQPNPEINISFDPTITEVHTLLLQIKEGFEFILQFMRLVNDVASSEDDRVDSTGPQDVFWRDVASTRGVKRKCSMEESLLDPVDIIDVPSAADIRRDGKARRAVTLFKPSSSGCNLYSNAKSCRFRTV